MTGRVKSTVESSSLLHGDKLDAPWHPLIEVNKGTDEATKAYLWMDPFGIATAVNYSIFEVAWKCCHFQLSDPKSDIP